MRLEGKVAIITGSSRGIGAETARLFASEGASVIVNCDEKVDEGREVVEEIIKAGGKATLCIADVRKSADAQRLAKSAIDAYGRIDILVNNAGILRDAMIENMTEERWREVLEVNLVGAFNCSKAVLPTMKAQKHGKIVNISSVVAEMGNVGQTNYIASKAGVIGLTKALALEFGRYGIHVNAVSPGFCDTTILSSIPKEIMDKIVAKIPMKRLGRPKEIAYAALFLASDECDYITGHILSVNGGVHI